MARARSATTIAPADQNAECRPCRRRLPFRLRRCAPPSLNGNDEGRSAAAPPPAARGGRDPAARADVGRRAAGAARAAAPAGRAVVARPRARARHRGRHRAAAHGVRAGIARVDRSDRLRRRHRSRECAPVRAPGPRVARRVARDPARRTRWHAAVQHRPRVRCAVAAGRGAEQPRRGRSHRRAGRRLAEARPARQPRRSGARPGPARRPGPLRAHGGHPARDDPACRQPAARAGGLDRLGIRCQQRPRRALARARPLRRRPARPDACSR